MAYMDELKKIAKAYCKKIGAELLFVKEDSFGYMDKNERCIHLYFDELAQILQEA